MTVELKVPVLPESVADATVAQWHKKPGDFVKRDENLVDLETDKVMLEVPAVQDGILEKIVKTEGSKVKAQEVLAIIKAGDAKSATKEATTTEAAPTKKDEPMKSAAASATSPSVRRMAAEHDVDLSQVKGSGKGERITKDDVSQAIRPKTETQKEAKGVSPEMLGERVEKRVAMSRLRARIAERLVEAQHSAAMLTTFNEVNMKPVMDLRAQYKEQFEKTHGVKLGLMSFFVKAAVEALKRFPVVNASIDGQDIVYHGYYDIGIAVSTERGLVVPVLRDVDKMSLAEIEKQIISYSARAREGKISIEEMTGGTFTITNGGVFGSMLSTPIINPPQCAILGMHNIVKRPVVENDQIVVRPMMYVAMSYDHRLIDGRESVSFLLTIKQLIEDPMRLILEV